MKRLLISWLSVICLASSPIASAQETARVEMRELTYRTEVRVTAFAEESKTIPNPISHPQIKFLIPDGAHVEKGDLITEFDSQDCRERLEQLELKKQTIEAELEQRLTGIRNKEMNLRDSLASSKDQLAVLDTKLARYKAMPDPDEVAIAEGRHRIADLQLSTADKKLAQAKDRYERQMISQAELDKHEAAWKSTRAAVEHATNHLAYVSLPTSSSTIRKTELEIENLQMEIDKLAHELEENANIARIQKEGAAARKEIVESDIKERRDDLEHTKVYAPISGYVMHLREFRNMFLKSGGKMWKHFNYLKIPNEDTLAFKGTLPESDRGFFDEGDLALLRVTERPDQVVTGRLASVSKLAHDLAEKEEVDWGDIPESGIMVYDIVVKMEKRSDWLRTGMHATCELVAGRKLYGPVLPITFVRKKRDDYYLSIQGLFEKVKGKVVDSYFLLDDDTTVGKTVDLHGRFPEASGRTARELAGYFRASGELEPSKTKDVRVKRIWRWQKVSWLAPEDSEVKTGDVVARLDSRETNEEISKWESRLKEAVSRRKELEEQKKLKEKEGAFQLAKEKNLLEIAALDLKITKDGRDWPALFDAELKLRELTITLESINRRLARITNAEITAVSPFEIERLQRDRQRTILQKEAAEIRLAKLQRGPTEDELARATFNHIEQKLKVDTLEKQTETENFRITRQLASAQRSEAHTNQRLAYRKQLKENLTLRATGDGLVQYSRIWNSGALTKVNVGSSVGARFLLVKIADVSKMHARIEIPEKYFTKVQPGLAVKIEIPSLTDKTLTGSVTEIEFLFESKRSKDTKKGLYSTHEALGETVFYAKVAVDPVPGLALKPSVMADVYFPFPR